MKELSELRRSRGPVAAKCRVVIRFLLRCADFRVYTLRQGGVGSGACGRRSPRGFSFDVDVDIVLT